MSQDFTEVRIVDNFYQTSSFIPMPVILVSTFAESGMINLGAILTVAGKKMTRLLAAYLES